MQHKLYLFLLQNILLLLKFIKADFGKINYYLSHSNFGTQKILCKFRICDRRAHRKILSKFRICDRRSHRKILR